MWKFTTAHPAGEWDESHVEKTRILVEIAEQNKNFAKLNENVTWKQLLLIENIPSSFTQYKVQWRGYKELLFAYGFYANVLETIIEPVFLFETHNGEGNRIVFGDSDEVEIYASLPNSDEAMFIKNSGRTTNLLRIYGR